MIRRILDKSFSPLKSLMLEQIYPAFLGSYIYMFYDKVFDQIFPFDSNFLFKLFLFVIALAFYYSDFYYIKFTNTYRWWFFVFDLAFLVTLLATIKFTDIEDKATPVNVRGILFCYSIFLFLYLLWDIYERRFDCCPDEEKPLYDRVISWEIGSVVILMIYALTSLSSVLVLRLIPIVFSIFFLLWDIIKKTECPKNKTSFYRRILILQSISLIVLVLSLFMTTDSSILQALMLIPITLIFWRLSYHKGCFYKRDGKETCKSKIVGSTSVEQGS